MIKWLKRNTLFVFTVAVPTLIAVIYYGFIASDVYVSESQIVIRSPEKRIGSGLGSMLQSTGIVSSNGDVYTIKDFILSRDALTLLDNKLSYRKLYDNDRIDPISRFNGFGLDSSFEALYKYYEDYVTVEIDSQSSTVKLIVEAFTAQDAKLINDYLVKISERLVNRLSQRGREDMIGFAEREVERATEKLAKASAAVSKYRQEKSVFNLEAQSSIQLKLVSKIQDELILTRSKLAQLQVISPQSAQIEVLKNKISSLQEQIEIEASKVMGSNDSFAQKSTEFEKLLLEREYAGKQLMIALASLEDARNEALRKQLYLERISNANLPDVPLEPKRIKSIITIFALGLITWGILSMLLAGIREHND
ncbi:capsule biosynthesis protein [Sulfurovum sp.]|uniref:capsule biosynthesis protein n=1 Tax=Sulfurovum sp. TaxID=1969726 RepID=UPI0025D7F4B2|nr:capsule biosynthesis protein [Sulfurovum sp.]